MERGRGPEPGTEVLPTGRPKTEPTTAAQTTPTACSPPPLHAQNTFLLFFTHWSQTLACVCQAFRTLPHTLTSVLTPTCHIYTRILHTPYVHVWVSLSPFVTIFPQSICKSPFARDTRETNKQVISVLWLY